MIERVYEIPVPRLAWEHLRPEPAVRYLERRVWPDALAMPRDSPSLGGSPLMPRYITPQGTRPIAAFLLLMFQPGRRLATHYLFRRLIPSRRWMEDVYGATVGKPASRFALLQCHWQQLRSDRRQVRVRHRPD